MFLFYRILITVALPFICLRLLWKSRRNPAYRQRMLERFACALPPTLPHLDWIHTVSVGEFLALKPLLERWLESHPQRHLWLTCTTPTASLQIQKWQALYPNRVRHSYLPYDQTFLLKRFLNHVRPENIVLMETEIWPNLIRLGAEKCPIVLENARLSARSCRRYRRFALPLLKRVLPLLWIHAQDRATAKRFRYLGADKISISPSLKFHPAPISALNPPLPPSSPAAWILLAASTHEGEEALLFQSFQLLIKKNLAAQLWLAPRHPERRDEILALAQKYGFQPTLRSRGESASTLFLIDTLGELRSFYPLANVAFIGGSLIPRGGHHPLEALQAGIPICFGRFMFHFQSIRDTLIQYDFVYEIPSSDAEHIALAIEHLLNQNHSEAIKNYIAPHHQVLQQHFDFWQRVLKI